ncbi:MAG: tRNA (guanosine(46)-N7)-methyltransferase TrmB [Bacteroidia bacterium]
MLSKSEKKKRYETYPYALWGVRIPAPHTWRKSLGFSAQSPLFVEIGCGKGEFSHYLAQKHPDALVVGIDRKKERLYAACCDSQNLSNVYFCHTDALLLKNHFGQGEVNALWLNYPDPFPKVRHAKHRLTHPTYLHLYKSILAPVGKVHLKTDSLMLYHYTLEMLASVGAHVEICTENLLDSPHANKGNTFPTLFQKRWTKPVRYIVFKFYL